MALDFNLIELKNLMKDFYTLTGIKIVLFDSEYHELLAYPDSNCSFCQYMKAHPATRKLCEKSDLQSFHTCQEQGKFIIYHCHAGLIEATAPLIDEHTVIGYLMFGQVADAATKLPSKYKKDVTVKTSEQIQAAAKIMEACTFYVVYKKSIRLQRRNFLTNMNTFLNSHLTEDLSVERITLELGISKSKLYQVCTDHLGCGIAKHIKSLRINRAKELLRNTDYPITKVAEDSGFSDYNYFCRIFKKETGISAKKYRESE